MTTLNKKLCFALLTASLALSACGGGGGGDDGNSNATKDNEKPATPAPTPTPTPVADANTVPISIERWAVNFANQPYVTVTICIPGVQGANQCATIDHMLIDTGSTGVRVLASALGPALAGRLPAQTGATDDPTSGAPIAKCAPFASGQTWGSIKRADVTIGGKVAGNLPIQVIIDGS